MKKRATLVAVVAVAFLAVAAVAGAQDAADLLTCTFVAAGVKDIADTQDAAYLLRCLQLLAERNRTRDAAGVEDTADFQLLDSCYPMGVRISVDLDDDDPKDYGVSSNRVRTVVESRLRAARLYADTDSWFTRVLHDNLLAVRVWFVGAAVLIQVEFWKKLADPVSRLRALVPAWTDERLGVHGGDGSYVMQHLSELIDRFILEYLRVNDEDCQHRDP